MIVSLLAFSVFCIVLAVIAAALAVTLPVVSVAVKCLLIPLFIVGFMALVLKRLK